MFLQCWAAQFIEKVLNGSIEISDVDVCQFCYKVTDTSYHYFQLLDIFHAPILFKQDKDILDYLTTLYNEERNTFDTNALIRDFKEGKEIAVKVFNTGYIWYDDLVDVEDYEVAERTSYLSSYYSESEIENMKKENINLYYQMVCEAIFETDYYEQC